MRCWGISGKLENFEQCRNTSQSKSVFCYKHRKMWIWYSLTFIGLLSGIITIIKPIIFTHTEKQSVKIIATNNSKTNNQKYDIIIGQFHIKSENNSIDISQRLFDNLSFALRELNLNDRVNIAVINAEIKTEDEAKHIAEKHNSRIIVWGWCDGMGISANVFFRDERKSFIQDEVPLEISSKDYSLSFHNTQKELSNNISFLSLYVLGFHFYQNNQFEYGEKCYNKAMEIIPSNLNSKDVEAIICFFKGKCFQKEFNQEYYSPREYNYVADSLYSVSKKTLPFSVFLFFIIKIKESIFARISFFA